MTARPRNKNPFIPTLPMTLILYLAALCLVFTAVFCWFLVLLGIPGLWIMVATTGVYALLVPHDSSLAIHWLTVGCLAGVAALAEVVEMVASMLGVAKVGGSRRGALLSLLGSMIGGLAGAFVGLPATIVGSVLAMIFCAALGAFLGAIVGETWKGRGAGESLRIGRAAFVARLVGTLAKVLFGSVMVVVVVMALAAENW